jgi:hypothetical protein
MVPGAKCQVPGAKCDICRMKSTLVAVVGMLVTSVGLSAQSFLIGPSAAYVVSTSVPEEVSQSGAPMRVTLGLQAVVPTRKSMEFRFDLNYRIENGSFTTTYEPLSSVANGSDVIPSEARNADVIPSNARNGSDVIPSNARNPRLFVVDPTPAPQVTSTLNTSSIELSAMMVIPVADLDTSGSKFVLELGVLADRVLTAEQTDDYSSIPNYPEPTTVNVAYEGQFGFGAMIGIGLILPVGSDRISFDLRYVMRQPTSLTSTTTPPVNQNVAWLIGRGLRIGLSYLFAF